MNKQHRVMVAGGTGLVGSALVRRLHAGGYANVLAPTRQTLDVADAAAVRAYLQQHQPDVLFIAAAKVGGIQANNTHRADFLLDNLRIQTSLIGGAHEAGIQRLMFLGSSCIYPRMAAQPITEDALLTGPLEPTNEPYAVAKIAGIKLCEAMAHQHGRAYVSVMPTNLYGPGDHYDLATSHVLPALIRKVHEAKQRGEAAVPVWGTGTPRREFLFVDDLADACVYLMEQEYAGPLLNIGTGEDISIRELTTLVMSVVGHTGHLQFDTSQPDGTPRKLLDVSRLTALGWQARTSLREGIALAYADYLARFG